MRVRVASTDYGTFRLYASDVKTAGLVERLELYFKDSLTTQVCTAPVLSSSLPE